MAKAKPLVLAPTYQQKDTNTELLISLLLQSQEMVEITRGRKEERPVCTSEEGFDLLAAEVEVLALEGGEEEEEEEEEEEDFEVIPVPDCFNLDVPFVLVEEEENNNTEEREEEDAEEVEKKAEEVEEDTEEVEEDTKTPLEEAMVAVRAVQVSKNPLSFVQKAKLFFVVG